MGAILANRFMRIDGDRACDLVTGAEVCLDAVTGFTQAYIDPCLSQVVATLEQGRDGCPRWVECAEAGTPAEALSRMQSVAAAGARRGFVALSPEVYLRFKDQFAAELRERTLLLVGGVATDRTRAHVALLDASALSCRPHVLVTIPAVTPSRRPTAVREAGMALAAPQSSQSTSADIVELLARATRAPTLVGQGRHAAAARLLREVAGSLGRRGAVEAAARTTIALARLFIERGHTEAAFAALVEAVDLAARGQQVDVLLEARSWQAWTRVAEARFVDAESICRALMAGGPLPVALHSWTRAVLSDALLWQGRLDEVPEPEQVCDAEIDPTLVGFICEIETRVLLARGRVFEAGQRVATSMALTARPCEALTRLSLLTADLGVLAAAGDIDRARDAVHAAVAVSQQGRAPLGGAWALLAWVDLLRAAGRVGEARSSLAPLRRLGRVAPPLLRREIAARVADESSRVPSGPLSSDARRPYLPTALVRLSQDGDDDRATIERLADRLSRELRTNRVDVLSAGLGPASLVCGTGRGLTTSLGARVIEAGLAVGPERVRGGYEVGVPVRLGSRTLGAIVGRWSADQTLPEDTLGLVELVATLAAPRLDALLSSDRDASAASLDMPDLVGVSTAIADVRKAVVRAASAPFGVLIEGESGVGKELVARAVHSLSPRRDGPFQDVNCAAIPDELLESELFGHARGAFSGAVTDRPGLFESGSGGTLFLDEVANLTPRGQAKLLRAIQQQEVRRVGESINRKVDVRLVAAANCDMRAEAAAGRFRSDLLYRLDVLRIRVPPLRERPDDIPILAMHYWRVVAARVGSRAELPAAVLADLARHHWPGNVRELQNVIASLAVAAPARGRVSQTLLPGAIGAPPTVSSESLAQARAQFERRFVEEALARAGGSRARAARDLGLSRQGLLKTLTRLGLEGATSGVSRS